MNNSRRSHRKSRGGCMNCKRRKIKCDERKPACGNCIKHSTDCDFALQADQAQSGLSPALQASASPSSAASGSQGPRELVSADDGQKTALHLQDLELLYHYCTSTALTMSGNDEIKTIWRIQVPKVGFSHEFVMRGILAVSALHLAYSKPAMRDHYLQQSLAHQDVAFRTARAVLSEVNEGNCNALYIFTAFAFICSLASSAEPRDLLLMRNEGATGWLSIMRGIRSIIQPAWPWLESGPFAPMFNISAQGLHSMELQADTDHLPELRRLILERENLSASEIEIYEDAVQVLNQIFDTIYRTERTFESKILSFVYRVRDEFFDNVADRKPEALVILAYYCILLKQLDGYWWLGKWGVNMLARIYQLLDTEHRLWIQRPIEETGLVL